MFICIPHDSHCTPFFLLLSLLLSLPLTHRILLDRRTSFPSLPGPPVLPGFPVLLGLPVDPWFFWQPLSTMKAMSGDHVIGERSLYHIVYMGAMCTFIVYMGAMCTYIHTYHVYIAILFLVSRCMQGRLLHASVSTGGPLNMQMDGPS